MKPMDQAQTISRQALVLTASVYLLSNALVGPVYMSLKTTSTSPFDAVPSLNIIVIGSIVAAVVQVVRTPKEHSTSTDLCILFGGLLAGFIPSSQVAWLSLAVISFWMAWRMKGPARLALTVLGAAAIREPIVDIALRLYAMPLVSADALIVGHVLKWTGIGLGHQGNILLGHNGHQVLILTGCSAFTNLSLGLLGWFSATRLCAGRLHAQHLWTGVWVSVVIIGINSLRLVLMAIDPDFHAYFHDGQGADIMQLTSTCVVVGLVIRSIRHDSHQSQTLPDSSHHTRPEPFAEGRIR